MNTKLISSTVTITMTIALTGCFSKNTGVESTTSLVPNLSKPSSSYLIPENSEEFDNSISEVNPKDQKQWLLLAKNYFSKEDYARALRASEISIAISEISETEEARKIAMLSTLYITKNNVEVFQNDELVDLDQNNELKKRLTNITTIVGKSRANLDK